jgi:hypothetical protein
MIVSAYRIGLTDAFGRPAAALRTVSDLIPVAGPLFPPVKRKATTRAALAGQISFFDVPGHI